MKVRPGQSWRILLLPFSFLYELVVRLRNTLYDQGVWKTTGFNMPIISVGNITVGGTGKTPHTEFLADLLKEEYKVAILSRGYMRHTRDFRIASATSTSVEIGDEPLQMKQRFPGVTVAVDRKRVHGIRELMKLAPPIELILLDDAYQHRSLKPGFSILLVDYGRPLWSDQMLPAGNLREPVAGRHRANTLLVTKCPENLKPIEMREYVNRIELSLGQHLFFTRMVTDKLIPVFDTGEIPTSEKDNKVEDFQENIDTTLVISGVVNPQGLVELAEGFSQRVEAMQFKDHHRYTEKDVLKIVNHVAALKISPDRLLIITTEKDAVKLRELNMPEVIRSRIYAARIRIEFLNGDQEVFEKQIQSYVTSNKRSSILYQGEDQ